MSDWELLQQYLRSNSQDAFARIVQRHLGWVRSAAMRQVRDAHLADDVAQAVFLALAQQAHRLHEGGALSTWLFKVTRYASSNALRAEARRRRHERQAAMTSHLGDASMTPQQWICLSPVLDKAVARLRRDDQRAVLLRFYEQKSYPEMAAALGVSAEAARKRTDRAIDKLRQLIGSPELTLSAGALSAGMLEHVTSPAPSTLAAIAIESGLRGADASTPIATIAKGAIQMMNFARLRPFIAASVALLLLIATGVTVLDAGPNRVASKQPATQPSVPTADAGPVGDALGDAGGEDSPKAVVFAAFRAAAAGDSDGLVNRFDHVTPAQDQTLRQVTQMMSAADRLSDAVKEQFGPEVGRQFSRAIGLGVAELDVESALEAIHGDNATVNIGTGPGEIPLVRSGQSWKISAEVLRTLNADMVRQMSGSLSAVEQLTADVRAGKFKTAGELRQAVGKLMRPARRPATAASVDTAASREAQKRLGSE